MQREREERLHEMELAIEVVSALNERFYSYPDEEKHELDECIFQLTGMIPECWIEKEYNRKQCYATMLSKLLLAYMISEIKEAPFLSIAVNDLEELAYKPLEHWKWFYYDDTGEEIGEVLDTLVRIYLKRSCLFQYKEYPLFLGLTWMDKCETDDVDALKRNAREIYKEILESCSKDEGWNGLSKDELFMLLEVVAYAENYEANINLEIVESSLLYEIEKQETLTSTELGQLILGESKKILPHVGTGVIYLEGTVFTDEKDKTVRAVSFSGFDDLSNEMGVWLCDPNNLFRYNIIFRMAALEQQMIQYQKDVLEKA